MRTGRRVDARHGAVWMQTAHRTVQIVRRLVGRLEHRLPGDRVQIVAVLQRAFPAQTVKLKIRVQ